ncbi:MAG: hypothetical protein GEU73_04910 [Chloroflexi bacterium]|nr:hypothetical protein [Chloroflexota bacterium]
MARTFSDGVEGQPGAAPESTLASGILAGAVTSDVQTGHGARFPATGDFSIRFESASDPTHFEIVTASARSTDTITHGATTFAWDADDLIFMPYSKADMESFVQDGDLAAYQALSDDVVTSTTQVVNTTTETDLYSESIAGGDAEAGTVYRLWATGDVLNNSGGEVTYTLRVKFGTTTVLESAAIGYGDSANRAEWLLDVVLYAVSPSAQRLSGHFVPSASQGQSWDQITGVVPRQLVGYGTATEDTSTAKTLAFTVEMGTANANADMRLHAAVLERIA